MLAHDPPAERAEAGYATASSLEKPQDIQAQEKQIAEKKTIDVLGEQTGDGDLPDAGDDELVYATGMKLGFIMCSIFLATLVAALDLVRITFPLASPVIPGITSDFHSLDNIGWYGGAIFTTVGVTAPICGKLYKYFSVRWVYLGCVVVYLVGSITAAAARDSTTLIVGRAIQGLGVAVAGVLGGSVLMIIYVSGPKARPTLIGVWTCVLMVSTILGPLLGGAFTGICFIVLLASVVCYTLAMQWAVQTKSWADGSVIAVLVVGLALTIIVFLIEWFQGEYALMPLRNLKPRMFWTNALYGWLVNLADFQVLFYLPVYFQSTPSVALFALGSLVSGILVSKTGHPKPFQLVSGVLATALLYTLEVSGDVFQDRNDGNGNTQFGLE
ncbi:major facilitator superfamily domain-containing protein [Lasiosphaeria hispida]|uniref:Major facilitator superfamily domain-containing protein n=1 Tax=Lasiosphaeria hispida TaxID=260671 RepID=A0AAJ0MBB2_9PEZI|nr:major facilitator superfamily domain-containing protein [Lasiosphaeria hispida]